MIELFVKIGLTLSHIQAHFQELRCGNRVSILKLSSLNVPETYVLFTNVIELLYKCNVGASWSKTR